MKWWTIKRQIFLVFKYFWLSEGRWWDWLWIQLLLIRRKYSHVYKSRTDRIYAILKSDKNVAHSEFFFHILCRMNCLLYLSCFDSLSQQYCRIKLIALTVYCSCTLTQQMNECLHRSWELVLKKINKSLHRSTYEKKAKICH